MEQFEDNKANLFIAQFKCNFKSTLFTELEKEKKGNLSTLTLCIEYGHHLRRIKNCLLAVLLILFLYQSYFTISSCEKNKLFKKKKF